MRVYSLLILHWAYVVVSIWYIKSRILQMFCNAFSTENFSDFFFSASFKISAAIEISLVRFWDIQKRSSLHTSYTENISHHITPHCVLVDSHSHVVWQCISSLKACNKLSCEFWRPPNCVTSVLYDVHMKKFKYYMQNNKPCKTTTTHSILSRLWDVSAYPNSSTKTNEAAKFWITPKHMKYIKRHL